MTGSDPSAAHASRRAPNRDSRPVRDSRPDRDCRPYRNTNQPAPLADAHHPTDADAAADSPSLGLIATDYQIGISPGRPGIGHNMEAYLWYPQTKAGSLSNVAIGAVPMTGGYRIEFAIPWSVFGITPAKGQVFGFAVSVSDNDNPSQNVQQTIISNAPKRALTDPTTWGLLTLK